MSSSYQFCDVAYSDVINLSQYLPPEDYEPVVVGTNGVRYPHRRGSSARGMTARPKVWWILGEIVVTVNPVSDADSEQDRHVTVYLGGSDAAYVNYGDTDYAAIDCDLDIGNNIQSSDVLFSVQASTGYITVDCHMFPSDEPPPSCDERGPDCPAGDPAVFGSGSDTARPYRGRGFVIQRESLPDTW